MEENRGADRTEKISLLAANVRLNYSVSLGKLPNRLPATIIFAESPPVP